MLSSLSVTSPSHLPYSNPKTDNPNPTTTLSKPHQLKTAFHLLQQCSNLSEVKQLHSHLIKTGLYQNHLTQNRLLSACIRNHSSESIDYALLLFSHSLNPTIFIRNNIIKHFAETETPKKSVLFYSSTHQDGFPPNNYTFPLLLKACSRLLGIEEGKQIHTHVFKTGFESDIHVKNTLIHFYCCCGVVDNARKVFDKMSERDVVTWNSMITGYTQNGFSGEALNLFRDMQVNGTDPDQVTMVSVLSACAHAGALELGKWVHAYLERNNLDSRISVKTALIDMYSKCGFIERALEVFEEIPDRNLVCWTAMINGLAINGHGKKAIDLFNLMMKSNVKPDAITLVSVLSACSHSGLLEEGRKLFGNLRRRYGITPQVEHYGCMVDLLGRYGLVDEAYDLIKKMHLPPNAVVWRTLLGACNIHKRVDLGELVLKKILELEPHHHGDFVLLSNLYATMGRWEDVENIRRMMKKKKISKIPGCSMIEIENRIYSFVVEDKSHRHSREIHSMLDQMARKIKLAGYVPDTSKVLINMEDEEEKANSLVHHSEKVAVAFGLIRTSPGMPLRIVKNLRVCDDCHCAMKLISKIYERDIILRDRNRFHHFKGGCCSCGDYW
ncbi:Pentatricopeptide repeat [Macleaya cordata]|uniref:Pentatricopeptide repeat n=1 Tax=Macleaya cordata TaxID=56857 RepID=A0A200R6F7_MACCD|nr:Pentatricopeptide repeat [Macleaya cordata]